MSPAVAQRGAGLERTCGSRLLGTSWGGLGGFPSFFGSAAAMGLEHDAGVSKQFDSFLDFGPIFAVFQNLGVNSRVEDFVQQSLHLPVVLNEFLKQLKRAGVGHGRDLGAAREKGFCGRVKYSVGLWSAAGPRLAADQRG